MESTKDIAQRALMTERDAFISNAISLKRIADLLDEVVDWECEVPAIQVRDADELKSQKKGFRMMERTKALLFGVAVVIGMMIYALALVWASGTGNPYAPAVLLVGLFFTALGVCLYFDIKEMRQ